MLAVPVIYGIGLLLTQSRGSLLGTAVAMAVTGALWKKWVRWILLFAVVGGGVALYFIGLEVLLDSGGMAGAAGSLEGRQELWNRALYIIQDFPFTGIRLHTFPVVTGGDGAVKTFA